VPPYPKLLRPVRILVGVNHASAADVAKGASSRDVDASPFADASSASSSTDLFAPSSPERPTTTELAERPASSSLTVVVPPPTIPLLPVSPDRPVPQLQSPPTTQPSSQKQPKTAVAEVDGPPVADLRPQTFMAYSDLPDQTWRAAADASDVLEAVQARFEIPGLNSSCHYIQVVDLLPEHMPPLDEAIDGTADEQSSEEAGSAGADVGQAPAQAVTRDEECTGEEPARALEPGDLGWRHERPAAWGVKSTGEAVSAVRDAELGGRLSAMMRAMERLEQQADRLEDELGVASMAVDAVDIGLGARALGTRVGPMAHVESSVQRAECASQHTLQALTSLGAGMQAASSASADASTPVSTPLADAAQKSHAATGPSSPTQAISPWSSMSPGIPFAPRTAAFAAAQRYGIDSAPPVGSPLPPSVPPPSMPLLSPPSTKQKPHGVCKPSAGTSPARPPLTRPLPARQQLVRGGGRGHGRAAARARGGRRSAPMSVVHPTAASRGGGSRCSLGHAVQDRGVGRGAGDCNLVNAASAAADGASPDIAADRDYGSGGGGPGGEREAGPGSGGGTDLADGVVAVAPSAETEAGGPVCASMPSSWSAVPGAPLSGEQEPNRLPTSQTGRLTSRPPSTRVARAAAQEVRSLGRRSALLTATALLRASEERQRQKHLDRRMASAESMLRRLLGDLPAAAGLPGGAGLVGTAAPTPGLAAAGFVSSSPASPQPAARPCPQPNALPPTAATPIEAAPQQPSTSTAASPCATPSHSPARPARTSPRMPSRGSYRQMARGSPLPTPPEHAGWEAAYQVASGGHPFGPSQPAAKPLATSTGEAVVEVPSATVPASSAVDPSVDTASTEAVALAVEELVQRPPGMVGEVVAEAEASLLRSLLQT